MLAADTGKRAMLIAVILVVFPFCMVHAAISDTLSMTISNRVTLLLIATFAIVAPLAGLGWTDYGMHFAAGALVLAVTFSLFAMGTMGGGDAKLLAATAVWMGWSFELVQYLVYSSFVGGILTVAILFYRRSALSVYTGSNPLLRNFADHSAAVPYGIALGIAGLLIYPETPLMQWAVDQLSGSGAASLGAILYKL